MSIAVGMQLATEEDVRLARRATVHGSLELNGALLDRLGPRLTHCIVNGPEQWYCLHALRRAAKLYKGDYLQELITHCADHNECNVESEYDRLYYLLTTGQMFGTEIEHAMSRFDEMGFYVATQMAEAGYDANHVRAVECSIVRLQRGFPGKSLMHCEFELALAVAFLDRLNGQPVNLSELLVIMASMDAVQKQRANIDLDRYFDVTWQNRIPGAFI